MKMDHFFAYFGQWGNPNVTMLFLLHYASPTIPLLQYIATLVYLIVVSVVKLS